MYIYIYIPMLISKINFQIPQKILNMSYAPVPRSKAGYLWGSSNAQVQVEFFHDVQCPFSRKFFNTLYPLISKPAPEDNKFAITISCGVLFGHNQAFETTRGAIHAAKGTTEGFIEALHSISENFDSLKNDACANKTRLDVQKLVAGILAKQTGESEEEFIAQTFDKDDTYAEAKVMFRNMILKGMFGTPSVQINGVPVQKIGSAMSLDEIKACFKEVEDMAGPAKFL
ncbi:hypothetical protein SARC_07490 [Sphaeroforma arctica JP610]|uniref:Thioredoxin-like fold domain-containing protein n=1 Tax=Sphaeroforma arctica JP610 TaxID=667725 RepID=A0A0L0FW35_9EUKA|nr:hypothetical protein SARC_07490 [Sphaeroforma arctica JP610]KNC80138.1 hypothetical protein SARC_07490 [Sphaeroforma arctica JP610]|eukprot:XP_014154040.1 hypothetical protein SARC_07490 [Sphaeroforma arctica JP610]